MIEVYQVTAADDPRLAWYRGVRDPELLRGAGRFVAEGRTVVARLLDDHRWAVESVLLSPAACASLEPALARRPGATVFVMPLNRLKEVAGYNIHRGALAIGLRPPPAAIEALVAAPPAPVRLLGLEALADPDNVGACFRNAAAFGVDAVLLDEGSVDPLYRKSIRTSMAAALRVPFARVHQWSAALAWLHAQEVTTLALTPTSDGVPLSSLEPAGLAAERLLVLVGSEGRGLASSTLEACSRRVRIPMAAGHDSVNVATAAAVALYAVFAARSRQADR
jgi:tRNA G18 (ribose-2'-O)-methylase SpoU